MLNFKALNLLIYYFTVPPPVVTLTTSPSTGPIYESTTFNITCTATVDTSVMTTASVVWTDPRGNVIPTNDTRRVIIPPAGSNLNSTLMFRPIDIGNDNNDTGEYNCTMTIKPVQSLILSNSNSTSINIAVESKSTLSLIILLYTASLQVYHK